MTRQAFNESIVVRELEAEVENWKRRATRAEEDLVAELERSIQLMARLSDIDADRLRQSAAELQSWEAFWMASTEISPEKKESVHSLARCLDAVVQLQKCVSAGLTGINRGIDRVKKGNRG